MKTNKYLQKSIQNLSQGEKFWKKVAQELNKSTRNQVEVNVSKLEEHCEEGDTVVVPGKVLGSGVLTKKLKVAAFDFSKTAKKFIKESGGETTDLRTLKKEKPKGSEVKIIK